MRLFASPPHPLAVTLKLKDVKETSLYVGALPRARAFYVDVLGLTPMVEDQRFCALDVNGRHVLLLFVRGTSNVTTHLPGGDIPPHDGSGQLHVGFAVDAADLSDWEDRLRGRGVEVESRVSWPLGGRSIYFRDPDGHLLELLTPGVWRTY